MATFLSVKGTWDSQGSIEAAQVINLRGQLANFCQVCPSGDHPEAGFACEWIEQAAPPDLIDEPLDTLTVYATGTGSWFVSYEMPSGLFTDTLAPADGPQNVPTGGQGPRTPRDVGEAHYHRVT